MNMAAKSWAQFLAHLEERERRRARKLPGWRTQRHRRRLTVVLAVANLLLIVGAGFLRQGELGWIFLLWFGAYLVWTGPFVLLRILTGKMSSSFSALLDEREREWRHRVSYAGYQTLTVLMVVAMCYLLAIARQPYAAERGAMMLAALLLLGSSVPTMLLGWTLPDDVPEEDSVG
jgi:peptidoglycan/LPS O-acetylase OafA/YrhL